MSGLLYEPSARAVEVSTALPALLADLTLFTVEPMDNNSLIQQLMMLGVGTTSLVAEKIKEVSEEWVKTGKLDANQASALVDDFLQQVKADQGGMEEQFQRQVRNILQDLGVPRQSEMDELRGRLDRLERQLRDMENRRW